MSYAKNKYIHKISKYRPPKRRNYKLLDWWSLVHLLAGVGLGWIMEPFLALVILVLWEPLEILILSPILARFGIEFGHESLRNSLSDIVFDTLGVAIGYYIVLQLIDPPFYLF